MQKETNSRRTRDDRIRYWTPRLVAIVVGLVVGVAGFWPGGRDGVAFLANWSSFCIQAGAIYLFLFEREFLANFVLDILDFLRRVREYREAAKPKSATSETQAAPPSAAPTSETMPPVAARATQGPPLEPQMTTELAPPRFQSRDRSSGFRALVGLVFVGLIAALLAIMKLQSVNESGGRTGGQVADVSVRPAHEPMKSQNQPGSAQTHAVQSGESCWSVAASAARDGERTVQVWLRILAANPVLCSERREQILRPGSTLEIPREEPQPTED